MRRGSPGPAGRCNAEWDAFDGPLWGRSPGGAFAEGRLMPWNPLFGDSHRFPIPALLILALLAALLAVLSKLSPPVTEQVRPASRRVWCEMPARASRPLSVRSWRMSRKRGAPSAVRSAISWRR